MTRLREVQGSLMVAALFEVFLGVTGAVGGLLRFIGEYIWPMCNNASIWCIISVFVQGTVDLLSNTMSFCRYTIYTHVLLISTICPIALNEV